MRASRLLRILTLLQTRSRVTAQDLATECEVSIRTIYRDMEALSMAGIPLYGDRGQDGGYRLLDGFKLRLNGLTPREAETLFLSGLSSTLAELGLGTVIATAQSKLLAALPAHLHASAQNIRDRILIDLPPWFTTPKTPPFLPIIANAVWQQTLLHIHYRSWRGERRRDIAPLGLIMKNGSWYLVAHCETSIRTYNTASILHLEALATPFTRPADFNLPDYWAKSGNHLDTTLHPETATLRVTAKGLKLLQAFSSPYARSSITVLSTHEGWHTLTLATARQEEAVTDILRLGPDAEILSPASLRHAVISAARAMLEHYKPPAPTVAAHPPSSYGQNQIRFAPAE